MSDCCTKFDGYEIVMISMHGRHSHIEGCTAPLLSNVTVLRRGGGRVVAVHQSCTLRSCGDHGLVDVNLSRRDLIVDILLVRAVHLHASECLIDDRKSNSSYRY